MSHERLVKIFDWLKIIGVVFGLCSPLLAGYISNEVSKAVVKTELGNMKESIQEIKVDIKEVRTDIKDLLKTRR